MTKLKAEMLPDYQKKYKALEKIAMALYRLEEDELFEQVIQRMTRLKVLIDFCKTN